MAWNQGRIRRRIFGPVDRPDRADHPVQDIGEPAAAGDRPREEAVAVDKRDRQARNRHTPAADTSCHNETQ